MENYSLIFIIKYPPYFSEKIMTANTPGFAQVHVYMYYQYYKIKFLRLLNSFSHFTKI